MLHKKEFLNRSNTRIPWWNIGWSNNRKVHGMHNRPHGFHVCSLIIIYVKWNGVHQEEEEEKEDLEIRGCRK